MYLIKKGYEWIAELVNYYKVFQKFKFFKITKQTFTLSPDMEEGWKKKKKNKLVPL